MIFRAQVRFVSAHSRANEEMVEHDRDILNLAANSTELEGIRYVGADMTLMRKRIAYPLAVCVALFASVVTTSAQTVSPEVQRLYAQAQQAHANNDEKAAEANYKKILQLAPDLGPAYNNLGRIYFDQGRYGEAVDTLSRGLAVAPDMAPAQVMLGASLLQLGDACQALPHLQAGSSALPDDRFARISLVRALIAVNHNDEALVQLNAMMQADPKDQEAWYLAGKIHLQLSQEDFAKVQSIDAKSSLAQVMAGEIMESMQNTPGAITAYKQAIATDGDNGSDALQHLAHLYWSTSDWSNAKAQYTVLLKREPGNCIARWRNAESRIELGENAPDLLLDLNKALEQCPTLAQAHADRARLLLRAGDAKAALQDLKTAEAQAPDEPTVQQLLAQAYRALGDRTQAEAANRRFAEMQQRMHQASEERTVTVMKATQQ